MKRSLNKFASMPLSQTSLVQSPTNGAMKEHASQHSPPLFIVLASPKKFCGNASGRQSQAAFLTVLQSVLTIIFLMSAFTACTTDAVAMQHTPIVGGIKIMPLGDSITYGYRSTDGGGYRTYLWQDLLQAGYHVHFVGSQSSGPASIDRANEGHMGWRIDMLQAHINIWLHTYQPQIILLHIGTNDILHKYATSGAPKRLSALLDQITNVLPQAKVIVAQIIPIGRAGFQHQVQLFNATIPTIVQAKVAQGKHVQYVDMYDIIPTSVLTDGVHPNQSGYRLMAYKWYIQLSKILAVPAKTSVKL